MKSLTGLLLTLFATSAFAGTLSLSSGESAVVQANTSTLVTCNASQGSFPGSGGGSGGNSDALAQCYRENASYQVQINQLQNDLYRCQTNQNTKVWNCSYDCGGNNGIGSDKDKATACLEAKKNSGVMCGAQCECKLE